MAEPFLLLDPGLVVPPEAENAVAEYQAFWVRVVGWAADRRVRLGALGRDVALERLGISWPNGEPPHCPTALAREAMQALNTLLTRVAPLPPDEASEGVADHFVPAYVRDSGLGTALAFDVAEQHECGLLGAATTAAHWSEPATVVAVKPGPPDAINLALDPHVVLPGEEDRLIQRALGNRRITLVGGRPVARISEDLESSFLVSVRWIEVETGREPNLEPLRGIRPEADVVFCITGHIGHAASEKALRIAKRRGVLAVCVEKASEVADQIRAIYGTETN